MRSVPLENRGALSTPQGQGGTKEKLKIPCCPLADDRRKRECSPKKTTAETQKKVSGHMGEADPIICFSFGPGQDGDKGGEARENPLDDTHHQGDGGKSSNQRRNIVGEVCRAF